jgi:RNA polymerase sigma-70 factor (ECF subfamily)
MTQPRSRSVPASVEKRAFKIAQLGLRNDDDALDAVQDAMMKLVQSYASRRSERWRPLFYRILANRIRDMQRRRTVRGRIMAWLPARERRDEEIRSDRAGAERRADARAAARARRGDRRAGNRGRRIAAAPAAGVPAAQFRRARRRETASAMGCSEGSVKTHYFRALETCARGWAKCSEGVMSQDLRKTHAEVLEESTARLDGRTLSRLTQARHAALAQLQQPAHGVALVRAGGAAAAVAVLAVVMWSGRTGRSSSASPSTTGHAGRLDAPDFAEERRPRVLRMGRG